MKITFTTNEAVPFERIITSMQLDSDQTLAHLKAGDYDVYLDVRGDVRVLWNQDPNGDYQDGEVYKTPSGFPEELMKIFESGTSIVDMKNIHIGENNWFEVCANYKGHCVLVEDDFDVELREPDEIFDLLWKFYRIAREKIESDRKMKKMPSVPDIIFNIDRNRAIALSQTQETVGYHDSLPFAADVWGIGTRQGVKSFWYLGTIRNKGCRRFGHFTPAGPEASLILDSITPKLLFKVPENDGKPFEKLCTDMAVAFIESGYGKDQKKPLKFIF